MSKTDVVPLKNETVKIYLTGQSLLQSPLYNKGTAFTEEERHLFGLHGLLPFKVCSLEEQVERVYLNCQRKQSALEKLIYLQSLHDRNETLFYRLLHDYPHEMIPYIYTPTVAQASLYASRLFRRQRGVYIPYLHKDKMEAIINNIPHSQIDLIIVTDGENVVGLGDLGIGGIMIPIGKLALYTLFGGIPPSRCLAICLDVGTNNKDLLEDPLYLGWRHKRISQEEYDPFIESFVKAIQKRFPRALLQWEDFSRDNAKRYTELYQDQICSYNDDVQGTACVILAALLSACKMQKSRLGDQRIAIFGSGSTGLALAQLVVHAAMEEGATEAEAKEKVALVDERGLIHNQLSPLDDKHAPFAQPFGIVENWVLEQKENTSLLDVVKNWQPTALIGVSKKPNAFTQEIVQAMQKTTDRPMIFPLSCPSEAKPTDLLNWTMGKAIVVTGTPFPPVFYKQQKHTISQCNTLNIFPGIGLGTIASKSRRITLGMLTRAAEVLSEFSPALQDPHGPLLPPLEDMRTISREIALVVGLTGQEEQVAMQKSAEDLTKRINKLMWFPQYPNYEKA